MKMPPSGTPGKALMSNSPYELVCGLEVHAELATASKMFCSCANDPFGAAEPNIHTCPVCLGMPGGLPVPNAKAIEWTLQIGLALGCEVSLFSKFDRKHYFYPDLPKGYQISQYDLPFCEHGVLETSRGSVRIRRIHLEEDTGKLQHTTLDGEAVSLIDFNRGGVPLVEIVTEPDIHSPEQAKEYGKKLRQLLRYLKVANCDMEQGGMRLEANISLRKAGEGLPNYKVEVKNINSFRFLEAAIGFEMQRQAIELLDGRTPAQETRGFNSENSTTFPQRTKEDAEDYRYFPEPDIPPLHFTKEHIESLRKSLPELPGMVAERWEKQYGVLLRFSESFLDSQETVSWFDKAFTELTDKNQAQQFCSDVLNGKVVVTEFTDATRAKALKDFAQLHTTESVDEGELSQKIEQVLSLHPSEVERYRAGESQLFNFLFGQLMKSLQKKLDVQIVRTLLEKKLKETA
jgi:aspartyl-tRNA(Asn)/glutamyl-tRNA(Gln) amidotransferase subunit B